MGRFLPVPLLRLFLASAAAAGAAACGAGTGPSPVFGSGADVFNGVYTGSGVATTNTCGFEPTAAVRAQLRVLPSGTGTWSSSHTGSALGFEFPVSVAVAGTEARFTASGSALVQGVRYTVQESVVLSGNSAEARESLSRFELGSLAPVCSATFELRLTR